jgi:hypothetical protein
VRSGGVTFVVGTVSPATDVAERRHFATGGATKSDYSARSMATLRKDPKVVRMKELMDRLGLAEAKCETTIAAFDSAKSGMVAAKSDMVAAKAEYQVCQSLVLQAMGEAASPESVEIDDDEEEDDEGEDEDDGTPITEQVREVFRQNPGVAMNADDLVKRGVKDKPESLRSLLNKLFQAKFLERERRGFYKYPGPGVAQPDDAALEQRKGAAMSH